MPRDSGKGKIRQRSVELHHAKGGWWSNPEGKTTGNVTDKYPTKEGGESRDSQSL